MTETTTATPGVLSQVQAPIVPKTEADHIREIRNLLINKGVIDAASYILEKLTADRPKEERVTEVMAQEYLLQYATHLLNKGNYLAGASLLWGDDIFSAEPRSVRMIWDKLPVCSEMLVMGAGAMGKSYSVAVWLLLDWLRDPTMTCIKVLSVTEEHAKRNVFAHIKNLHASAIIPLPGDRKDKSIQVGKDDKQGIHLMTIPIGDEGKGRLRGFHPVPRAKPHKQFGKLSRIRVILDESEEIPGGVWEDVDNILITKEGVEHVKVIGASNPKDRNSKFGIRCEPKAGWSSVSIEESEEWMSQLGWQVLRLDGAKCENVVHRRTIYPGLLTWDGYQRYLALGDNSPSYFTMARGWFPEQGLQVNVIPADFIDKAKGTFIFSGKVTYCAAVDLAFEGGDLAIMTVGRWGTVTGWTPHGKAPIMFEKSRYGLQIEQQFELQKTSPVETPTPFITNQIIKTCRNLHIPPEWLVVDRTGNGTGVYDLLRMQFGHQVMGVHFGEGSTEKKVLEDDTKKACDLYDGIVTELFFACRKFMEFDYLKLGVALKLDKLSREWTNRMYKPAKGELVRVESKKEYKARGFDSPDYADSGTLLVHLVRMRSEFTAMMLVNRPDVQEEEEPQPGVVDTLNFITFDS